MCDPTQRQEDLRRIETALREAEKALAPYTPGAIAVERKAGGDPVTEADHRVDDVLRDLLPSEGEGWLSEETVDDHVRLGKRRAWVVITNRPVHVITNRQVHVITNRQVHVIINRQVHVITNRQVHVITN